ncbi:retrovirus-related pol polyprotein from transposon TNT 1-94 [Tanacetum coccineum]
MKPLNMKLPRSLRIHIEQRIAAMMGYRGGRLEGDEEKLDDVLFELESSFVVLDGPCDGLGVTARKWPTRRSCGSFSVQGFKGGACKKLRDEVAWSSRKKQVTFEEQFDTSNSNTHKHVEQLNIEKTNVPVPPSTGVNCCPNASGSQPRRNTKKNRVSPTKGVNKKKVEKHPRINKSNLRTMNCVDSSSGSKRNTSTSIHNNHNVVHKVKQVWKPKQVRQVWKPTGKALTSVGHQWRPTSRIFTLGEQCPLTRLTKPKVAPAKQNENQVITCGRTKRPLVFGLRFGISKVTTLVLFLVYGDYVIGDSVISKEIFYQKKIPRTLQQNRVVERRNRTLVEAARTMLIFSKAPMFLWAEVVATAGYTQNRSLIHTLHNKTPYELVHDKKPDLTFFRVFGALCYPTNDSEDLGKLQPTADIGYSLVLCHLEGRVIEFTTKEPDELWKLFTFNSMS